MYMKYRIDLSYTEGLPYGFVVLHSHILYNMFSYYK